LTASPLEGYLVPPGVFELFDEFSVHREVERHRPGFGFGLGGRVLGFRGWNLGLRVQGLGFRVQGLGFRVWGSGIRFWGLGFRA
jgi:hypothetical protein